MADTQFDPRDVLEKYVSLLHQPAGSVVRETTELAHPKDAIKAVLQHCIRTSSPGESRDFLHEAYVSLGSFQSLSEEEREALAVLSKVGAPGPEGSKLFGKQAREITHVAAPLQVVLDRVKDEMAVLTQELKSLPNGSG
jgi:hypothetical protein